MDAMMRGRKPVRKSIVAGDAFKHQLRVGKPKEYSNTPTLQLESVRVSLGAGEFGLRQKLGKIIRGSYDMSQGPPNPVAPSHPQPQCTLLDFAHA